MTNLINTDKAYPCFCVSNEDVIKAILIYTKKNKLSVIIESTSSQVNQFGGYTKKHQKNLFIL